MAVTRQDIIVPAQTWVNCYAASGITVGAAVGVYNKGVSTARLVVSLAAPVSSTIGVPIFVGDVASAYRAVSGGEVGLWAYSEKGTTLLVQES